MKYSAILTALALTLGLNIPASNAEEDHMHEQHEAHEHGAAQLNIVVEPPLMMLELRVSAMDIVGFEHAPRDDKQKTVITQAEQKLMQAGSVFGINASAVCQLSRAQAKRVALNAEHGHHDEHAHHHDEDEHKHHTEQGKSEAHHHDEDEHKHHAEHGESEVHHHDEDEHHDEHAESDMHSDEKRQETHAEFHSSYAFRCANPASDIDVHLFKLYPSIAKIQVQAVTATGQAAPLLTPSHAHIYLP